MKYTILILLVALIAGCNNLKKEKVQKEEISSYNYEYEKVKNYFSPQCFFSHFPTTLNSPFFYKIITDDMAISYSYVLTVYNCNSDSLKHLSEILRKTCIKSYLSTDSTMLIIKNGYSYQKVKTSIMEGQILVPFFYKDIISSEKNDFLDFFSLKTPTGLSSNFEMFIIESKSVYNSTELEKTNIFGKLPRGHNKVYSRGICINLKSKYAIYWTIFF